MSSLSEQQGLQHKIDNVKAEVQHDKADICAPEQARDMSKIALLWKRLEQLDGMQFKHATRPTRSKTAHTHAQACFACQHHLIFPLHHTGTASSTARLGAARVHINQVVLVLACLAVMKSCSGKHK